MGYSFTLIGAILIATGGLFTLVGVILAPKDNVFRGPESFYQKIIQTGIININNSFNIGSGHRETINNGLVYNDATVNVTNKLLEISKLLKDGRVTEAETILRSFEKESLTSKDATNIQSVRAGLYLAQGKFTEAKAIYESILDTGTRSNAVYSGLGTIAAFEAFKFQKSDSKKAIELLYESNEWYFQALDIDKRPQVLVTLYFNIYDNFRILTEYFSQTESANVKKYQELFFKYSELSGNPDSSSSSQVIEQKFDPEITKQEFELILKSNGLNFDISAIPDTSLISSYHFDGGDISEPVLNVEHSE